MDNMMFSVQTVIDKFKITDITNKIKMFDGKKVELSIKTVEDIKEKKIGY